jgi:hypothetical protein
MALIFTTVLILNLLPQISHAWRLEKNGNDITLIYRDDDEKEDWKKYDLPHAIHSKLITRKTTVLDIAKMAEKEKQDNPQGETIVQKIQGNTTNERRKMIVKWEKDNEYVDEKVEQLWGITPPIRKQLLAEIEEEEEKESEKTEQFLWKKRKARGKFGTAVTAGVVSIFFKKDILTIAAIVTVSVAAITTTIDILEIGGGWGWRSGWNGIKELLGFGKSDFEEAIKLPPLRNMPVLPKDYKRVDVYSYGL